MDDSEDDVNALYGEITELETTVAELVGLLRMGRELSEASRDIEVFRFCTRDKVDRATSDVKRILALYDAAIVRYGGVE